MSLRLTVISHSTEDLRQLQHGRVKIDIDVPVVPRVSLGFGHGAAAEGKPVT